MTTEKSLTPGKHEKVSVNSLYKEYFICMLMLSLTHSVANYALTGFWLAQQTINDNPMIIIDVIIFVMFYVFTQRYVCNKKWLAAIFAIFFCSQLSYYAQYSFIDVALTVITFSMMYMLAINEAAISNITTCQEGK